MNEFHGNQHTSTEYESYTYGQLVVDARHLARELGRSPTTQDAREDEQLPCLARIYDLAEGGWLGVLEDAGLERTQVEAYSPEDRDGMKADLRRAARESSSDRLTTREYDDRGRYATSTIKTTFGSWTEACSAAGISAGSRHGTTCTGPNGERLDSGLERDVANWLDENGIEYVPHPPVDGTNWLGDFYLPAVDLWVEVDGYPEGDRPNEDSFEKKLNHYVESEMAFIVVGDRDGLERKLLERGATNSP